MSTPFSFADILSMLPPRAPGANIDNYLADTLQKLLINEINASPAHDRMPPLSTFASLFRSRCTRFSPIFYYNIILYLYFIKNYPPCRFYVDDEKDFNTDTNITSISFFSDRHGPRFFFLIHYDRFPSSYNTYIRLNSTPLDTRIMMHLTTPRDSLAHQFITYTHSLIQSIAWIHAQSTFEEITPLAPILTPLQKALADFPHHLIPRYHKL